MTSWLRFASPEYLLLLVWFFWRTGRAARAGTRATVLRCALASLLVLGLAGLQIRSGSAPLSAMFVMDRSDSMGGSQAASLERVNAMAAAARPGDRAGIVVFGADSAVEHPPLDRLALTRVASVIDGAGTNIEAALRAARAALPDAGVRRLILVSDGRQTDGDAVREATLAAVDRVAIDVALPESRQAPGPVTVTRVTAAPAIRVREPFLVTVTAEGRPGTRGTIVLGTPEGQPQSRDVTIAEDGLATVTFAEQQDQPGVYAYQSLARTEDDPLDGAGADPNAAGAVVVVSGEPSLLYVGESEAVLRPALAARGFRVDVARTLPGAAELFATVTAYDALILDDVDPNALDAGQNAGLVRYVEETGGGLLVLGSRRSLTPGLPPDGAFSRLLPVDLRPRTGSRGPGAALVVVFDKSGSMDDRVGGTQKIEIARQAVQRVLDAMPATDALGVIAFDAAAIPVAPLAPVGGLNGLGARLRAIQPSGATAVTPALSLARDWLQAPAAAGVDRRHILLVSDGRTSPADAASAEAALLGQGLEVTAIALGGGSDRAFLTRLAASTGGRAFFPEDVRHLPSILAREAVRVSGGGSVEEPFSPRALPHPMLTGIDTGALPRLGGYVVSAARPAADTVLQSHLGDPILAVWQAGLGKAAVYTADLRSSWSSALRTWADFDVLAAQLARWLSRRVTDDSVYLRVEERAGRPRLVVDVLEPGGTVRTLLDAEVSVRGPSGDATDLALIETSPGRYEAALPVRGPGPHMLALRLTSRDGRFETRLLRGFHWSAARERRATGADRSLLAAVAAAAGGRVLTADDNPFAVPRPGTYLDARPWLLSAALALFLTQIVAPAAVALLSRRPSRRRTSRRREAA